jgi:hypothetical protein
MRRQAITGTYVLHEHMFSCQGIGNSPFYGWHMATPTPALRRRWLVWLLIGLAFIGLAWVAMEVAFAINHSA